MAYLAIQGSNCSWGFFAGCISYKSKSPWAAGFPISDDSGWMQYQNREVSKTQRKMATKKYKPNWLDKQPSSTSPYFENSFFRVVSSMAYGSPTSRLIRNRIRYPDSIKESYIQKVPEENKIDLNIPATKSFEEDMHLTAWSRGELGTEVLLSTFPILLVKAMAPIPRWKPSTGTESGQLSDTNYSCLCKYQTENEKKGCKL